MDRMFISWRLYSCRRLTCTSKMKSGFSVTPSCLAMNGAQLLLLQVLDIVEFHDGLVVDLMFQLTDEVEVLQEVAARPFPAAWRYSSGLHRPSQRRGVMPLVLLLEPLGEGVVPVLEAVVLQNLGVDLRHAVDIGADVNGQVRHVGGVCLSTMNRSGHARPVLAELLVNAAR